MSHGLLPFAGRSRRLGTQLETRKSAAARTRVRGGGGRTTKARHLTLESLENRLAMDGTPVISEFLAVNNDSITDVDGDHSDWIELHNPTDQAYGLLGWNLTDDPANLTKWQIPGVTMTAG